MFSEGKDDFNKKIDELRQTDLTKISLIDGLDKLVDICINNLFERMTK